MFFLIMPALFFFLSLAESSSMTEGGTILDAVVYWGSMIAGYLSMWNFVGLFKKQK